MKLTKTEKDIIVVSASMLRSEMPLFSMSIDELILEANADFDSLEEDEIKELKEYILELKAAKKKFEDHRMPCAMVGKNMAMVEIVVTSIDEKNMICEDSHGWIYKFNLKDADYIEDEKPEVGDSLYLKSRLLRVGPGISHHDNVFIKGIK